MTQITRVALIGAGTMGTRLALNCALAGKTVSIYSLPAATMPAALVKMQQVLVDRVRLGKLSAQDIKVVMARVRVRESLHACVSDAELVIEVVPERLELKRRVVAEIDRAAPHHPIIATASSSIPCSRLADVTGCPDRLLNIHFYQSTLDEGPAEVMGNDQTSADVMTAGVEFVRSLGLVPIVVKRELMGFGTNTIWHVVKKAALQIVSGGHVDLEDIDRHWLLTVGPQPPFARMDQVGLDVVRDIEMEYYRASGDERDLPPEFLDRWVAQGRLGVKSGRGFYTYPDPEYSRPGWLRKEPPWMPEMAIRIDRP